MVTVACAEGLRPTSERVRETVFDWLTHLFGTFEGRDVLDMFAGSGAMGLEAASRGADHVDWLDIHRPGIAGIRQVLVRLGGDEHKKAYVADAFRFLQDVPRCYDVIFIDPPFGLDMQVKAARAALNALKNEGLLYVESPEELLSDEALASLGVVRVRSGSAGRQRHGGADSSVKEREEEQKMTTAVYPGTFDPMTNGHVDLVRRASRIFEHVVVGVAESRKKRPLLSLDTRVRLARGLCGQFENVTVMSFNGLLKDFVAVNGAQVIIRGARAVSDFEYEFQMAGMNRQLMPDVETIFLTPSDQFQFVSGTFVREIAQLSPEDAARFVTPDVLEALIEACADKKE